MTLKDGVLDFGTFRLTPETTPAQVAAHCPGAVVREAAGTAVIRCTQALTLGGAKFLCEFYFKDSAPTLALLRPLVDYPDGLTGRAAQQDFRRAACERWLSARLGEPAVRTPAETRYSFAWGRVAAVSHFDPRSACDAGYICVRYER